MKKLFTWKKIILYIIIIIIIWSVYSYFQSQNAPKKVTVINPVSDELIVTVSANGKIQSQDTSSPRFAASGRISALYVQEGDQVKKGQILGYIDGSDIKQQENQTWADYKIALEKLREFELNYQNKPQDDRYWIAKNQLEAQRDRSAAAVAQTRTGYSNRSLIAPISGTITKIYKTQGEVVASEPVVDIQNESTLEFVAEVDEQDIGDVREGQRVMLNLDAYPQDELEATITKIENIAKTGSTGNTYFPVSINVVSTIKPLRIGMNGDAIITTAQAPNKILLPLEYLIEENNETYVYLVENGLVKKQTVTTGLQSDSVVEIISGINTESNIISSDASLVKENEKVEVVTK